MEQASKFHIKNIQSGVTRLLAIYKTPLIVTFITAVLTYIYAFTNKIPNHDDVSQLFAKGATIRSGRWGLALLSYVFPNFSTPWINGIISVLFISIAVCVIIRIFEIKSKVYQGLLAALIVVFPSLIGTFTYMFTAPSFCLSFLFSVIAVFMLTKNKIWGYVFAVLFMVLSLGIYQSYISVAVGLCIVLIVKQILDINSQPKTIFINIIKCISFIIISMVLYYLVTQLVFVLTGTSFGKYADTNLNAESESLFQRFKIAYAMFFGELFAGTNGLVVTLFSRVMHAVLLVVICCKGIVYIFSKNTVIKKLLLLAIAFCFPLGINCIFLVTDSSAVHTTVMYGFISFYLLAIVLLENIPSNEQRPMPKKAVSFVSVIACGGIVISNIYLGNVLFLKMQLNYENTYSFYTSLVTQIKSNPKFIPGTKVAIIGETDELIYPYDEFAAFDEVTGADLGVNIYSRNQFIKYYIGFNSEFATDKEIKELSSKKEFKTMPDYPYYNSIKKIGNYLVVKFSDITE